MSASIVQRMIAEDKCSSRSKICSSCRRLAYSIRRCRLVCSSIRAAHYQVPLVAHGIEYFWFGAKGLHGDQLRHVFLPLNNAAHMSHGSRFQHIDVVSPRVNYELLKNWINSCEKKHPHCRRPHLEELGRIRVVDVKAGRIVDLPQSQDYLALSYVWGGIQVGPRRDRDRLPKSLPRTIEDAITVTRKLGQQYLWVDSLCIDQEDAAHRKEQIQIMDIIYECAFATIIVADGEASDSGIPGVNKTPRRPQMLAKFGDSTELIGHLDLHEDLAGSAWQKRGWTFQEGLLSARRLVFTNEKAHFYCGQAMNSEDLPKVMHNLRSNIGSASLTFRKALALYSPSILGEYGRRDLFVDLVSDYTARQLTLDSDALIAASALLSRLSRTIFPRGFHYGLPIDDFPAMIWWRAYGGGCYHRRRGENIPSYSWAGWHRAGLKIKQRGIKFELINGFTELEHVASIVPLHVTTHNRQLVLVNQNILTETRVTREMENSFSKEHWKQATAILHVLRGIFNWESPKSGNRCHTPPPMESALVVSGLILTLPLSFDQSSTRQCCADRPHLSWTFDSDWLQKHERHITYDHFLDPDQMRLWGDFSFDLIDDNLSSGFRDGSLAVELLLVSCFAGKKGEECWQLPGAGINFLLVPLLRRDGYFERCSSSTPTITCPPSKTPEADFHEFLRLTEAKYEEFWLA